MVHNLKNRRQENLELETSANEWSSSGHSSSKDEEESSSGESDSTLKLMGITLRDPTLLECNLSVQAKDQWDVSLETMLSKDLPDEEREGFKV